MENLEQYRVNCMDLVECAYSAAEQLCDPGSLSSLLWVSFISSSSRAFRNVSFWMAKC